MKNQYFGDIGDYGKYSLLRAFANKGIRIGVNWYLTKDDNSLDGKHITYLQDPSEERYDPELFTCLKQLVDSGKRDVEAFETENMIPNALYYHDLLDISGIEGIKAKRAERRRWHITAMETLQDSELVFLDPDNGLWMSDKSVRKDSVKYAYAIEAAEYYRRGQNVVYYCHKGRRNWFQWDDTKKILCELIPDAIFTAVTFHRGTQRTFILAIHEKDFKRYYQILSAFLNSRWTRHFTTEPVNNVDSEMLVTGDKLRIELMNEEIMTIETTLGGDVLIRFSGTPNRSLRMDADQFAAYFRR